MRSPFFPPLTRRTNPEDAGDSPWSVQLSLTGAAWETPGREYDLYWAGPAVRVTKGFDGGSVWVEPSWTRRWGEHGSLLVPGAPTRKDTEWGLEAGAVFSKLFQEGRVTIGWEGSVKWFHTQSNVDAFDMGSNWIVMTGPTIRF